jgi:SpoVK/Ycf46/Vps4 family AAA+-type ATPase
MMSLKDVRDIHEFLTPDQIKDRFFAGYNRELNVGFELGIRSAKRGVWKALLFGLPGCGKSEYPYALVAKLNLVYKLHYSLLYIKCQTLASTFANTTEMKQYLDDKSQGIRNHQPVVLAFDELDAISERREFGTSQAGLAIWVMSFLSTGFATDPNARALIFGITNYPQRLDPAVRDRFDYSVYFEVPREDVVAAILENNGFPRAAEVAKCLESLSGSIGYTFSGRGIFSACRAAKRIEGSDFDATFEAKSSPAIAQYLLTHAAPVYPNDISDYERQNHVLILKSQSAVDFWDQKFKGR